MSSAQAARLALHAITVGVDRVPDRYWDKVPDWGLGPSMSQRTGQTSAKAATQDSRRKERGRRDDRNRHKDHRHEDRARSEGYEAPRDRRPRDSRGRRVETWQHHPQPAPAPQLEDKDFYSDVERRRLARRRQIATWAATQDDGENEASSPGYLNRPPTYSPASAHDPDSLPGHPLGHFMPSAIPSYLAPHHTVASAPVSAYHSPASSRTASAQGSPRSGNSRPPSQYAGDSPSPPPTRSTSGARQSAPPPPALPPYGPELQQERYVHPPMPPRAPPSFARAPPPPPVRSRAAQKYTPPGVPPGQKMYGTSP